MTDLSNDQLVPGGIGQYEKNGVDRLPVYRASDLLKRPVPLRKWIVQDLVPARTVSILSAHGGVGKTVATLQLLAAAASGGSWLGRDIDPIACFGVFAEDDADELHRRLDAIVRVQASQDVDALELVSLADREAILAVPRDNNVLSATPLFSSLRDHALAMDARLVILDPAADLFGGDEINRAHVRAFISMLRRLAMDIDGAVLLTAHPSREGIRSGDGYSGSTAWHNSVRSLLYLTRPKPASSDDRSDTDRRTLKHLKSNLGPLAGDIDLRWQEGVFVLEHQDGGLTAGIKKRAVERQFLDALDKLHAQNRYASDSRNSSNYAPKVLRQVLESPPSKRALEEAMFSLLRAETIHVGTFRTAGRKNVSALERKRTASGRTPSH